MKRTWNISADELLFIREIRGLKIATTFRIIWLLGLIVGHLFTYQSHLELVLVTFIITTASVASVLFWYFLQKKKLINFVGISGALIDVLIISILPFIWYESVGSSEVAPAFMVKGGLLIMIFVFMTVNGLSLQPRYPLIVMTGSTLLLVAMFIIIMGDPQTVLSYDLTEIFIGIAFSPVYFILMNFLTVLLVGISIFFITATARKTIFEAVKLEKANSQMERFFSPNVVSRIVNSSDDFLKPGYGHLQKVAIMFADIRDFTRLSESMAPDKVLRMLSEYQTLMVEIIFKYGGTLDKFLGDGIMATFGTPEPASDDAQRAVMAGIEMKQALREFNEKRQAGGIPPLRQGIGIDYGEVIAGNAGSENRLEYTVIGDAVNSASRIESVCSKLGEEFLVSETVANELKGSIGLRKLGRLRVKGKSKELQLYAVEMGAPLPGD